MLSYKKKAEYKTKGIWITQDDNVYATSLITVLVYFIQEIYICTQRRTTQE